MASPVSPQEPAMGDQARISCYFLLPYGCPQQPGCSHSRFALLLAPSLSVLVFFYLFFFFFKFPLIEQVLRRLWSAHPVRMPFIMHPPSPRAPQLGAVLTAGTRLCLPQETKPRSAPSSQGARAEPITDALRSPEPLEGFAGAGQAPGSFLPKAAAPVPPVWSISRDTRKAVPAKASPLRGITPLERLWCARRSPAECPGRPWVIFPCRLCCRWESLAQEPGEAVPAAPGWVISPWKEHTAVSSFLGLSQPPRHGVRHCARRTAAGLAVSRSLRHC